MTTDLPTWLTGLFVTGWIARSAAVRRRNSRTSPVRVSSSARSRVTSCGGMVVA